MLIELAIAAFVIGIGILALLGLAHVAERAASDTESETRAALFADEVFTTLRIFSDRYAQSTNQMEWVGFWTRVAAGGALPLATEGLPVWKPMTAERPRLIAGDGDEHAAFWVPAAAGGATPDTVQDFSMNYRLTIARPGQTSGGTAALATPPPPAMLLVTLHVWSGVGKLAEDPFTFFTSFSNAGSLP